MLNYVLAILKQKNTEFYVIFSDQMLIIKAGKEFHIPISPKKFGDFSVSLATMISQDAQLVNLCNSFLVESNKCIWAPHISQDFQMPSDFIWLKDFLEDHKEEQLSFIIGHNEFFIKINDGISYNLPDLEANQMLSTSNLMEILSKVGIHTRIEFRR